jgi:hypothetical protein
MGTCVVYGDIRGYIENYKVKLGHDVDVCLW